VVSLLPLLLSPEISTTRWCRKGRLPRETAVYGAGALAAARTKASTTAHFWQQPGTATAPPPKPQPVLAAGA
jgi:hypothetical protein